MATKSHQNIVDYVKTNFNSFSESPLNELDAAVFSELTYYHYAEFLKNHKEKIAIKDLYDFSKLRRFLERPAFKQNDYELITSMCGNPRFKDIVITKFKRISSPKKNEQFSAITLILPTGDLVVAYRGTDSTLIGWKEDFDMAYKSPVPSQVDAASYLKEILFKFRKRKVYIVGHSKGGNLAVYSFLLLNAKQKKRIPAVYSFDGPGFGEETSKKTNIELYRNKIIKFVPEQSIIGMIYDNASNCAIVKSESSWLSQHNLYNWHIAGDTFVAVDKLSSLIEEVDIAVNEWVEKVSNEKKELLVETFYKLVNQAGIENSVEMVQEKKKSLLSILDKYKELDKETRLEIKRVLKSFVSLIWASIRHKDIKDDGDKKYIDVFDE